MKKNFERERYYGVEERERKMEGGREIKERNRGCGIWRDFLVYEEEELWKRKVLWSGGERVSREIEKWRERGRSKKEREVVDLSLTKSDLSRAEETDRFLFSFFLEKKFY